jgi:hypothetical protein
VQFVLALRIVGDEATDLGHDDLDVALVEIAAQNQSAHSFPTNLSHTRAISRRLRHAMKATPGSGASLGEVTGLADNRAWLGVTSTLHI